MSATGHLIARESVMTHAQNNPPSFCLIAGPPAPVRLMREIIHYFSPSDPIPATIAIGLSTLGAWGMTFLTWYTSDLPITILILSISMVADYLTGFLAAHITKTWDKTKGTDGLLKKVVVLITLIVFHYVVKLAGGPPWVSNGVNWLFVWNEWKSSIVNLRKAKVDVPAEADGLMDGVRGKLVSMLKIETTTVVTQQAEPPKEDPDK